MILQRWSWLSTRSLLDDEDCTLLVRPSAYDR